MENFNKNSLKADKFKSLKVNKFNKLKKLKIAFQLIGLSAHRLIRRAFQPFSFSAFQLNGGFTLIEILITIGIIAVVSTVGFLSLFGYRGRQDLDLTTQEIVITLRNAQDRSISQEIDAGRFGVHFENPSSAEDFYDLFSGTTYATGTIISKNSLRSTMQFSDPTSGNNKDVIFTPVNGLPNASTTITISLKRDSSILKNIIINTNGRINY